MAHEVETMMSVRLKPWHYEMTKDVTKIIQIAPNSHQALVAAGLDWTVESKPIYDAHGNIIKGFKANTRSSDSKVLGIVSDRYKIVQNVDAFQFTDNLIGGDVRYETAGSLLGGQKVWMLAKMPEKKIAGDDVETYVCFTNSHDGKGSVKAIVTPIRVVCQNTMNIALSRAQRSWSIRHQGNIENKIAEAREVLELTDIYMEELAKQAERWANVTINEDAFQKILNKIFPVKEDDTDRKKNNVQNRASASRKERVAKEGYVYQLNDYRINRAEYLCVLNYFFAYCPCVDKHIKSSVMNIFTFFQGIYFI